VCSQQFDVCAQFLGFAKGGVELPNRAVPMEFAGHAASNGKRQARSRLALKRSCQLVAQLQVAGSLGS